MNQTTKALTTTHERIRKGDRIDGSIVAKVTILSPCDVRIDYTDGCFDVVAALGTVEVTR